MFGIDEHSTDVLVRGEASPDRCKDPDALPLLRYRGLTVPKLRLWRVKIEATIEKCRRSED